MGPINITEMFCTLKEASETLKVNRLTIRRWIKSGKIQAQRVGGEVLIERRLVETLAKEKFN